MKEKPSQWISILDKDPPAGQGVLIALNTGAITIGYRVLKKNSHDWQIFGDMNLFGITQEDYVTHWMKLPSPPDFKLGDKTVDHFRLPRDSEHYPS